tara:strand:- start:648 stop:1790 length:1143 start_codon:yes stop_codon:yes gene_type:complete
MLIWLAISSITILTVFILISPLVFFDNKKKELNNEGYYDINIYKDQLNEINKDIDRGVLSKEDYISAKNEISRRILLHKNPDNTTDNNLTGNSQKFKLFSVIFVSLLIPIVSLNLYFLLGNPTLPNKPFANNISENKALASNSTQPSSIEDSVIQLKKRLAKDQDDIEGWLLLGRSYLVMRNPDQAILAFRKVIKLDPNYKEIYSFIGEALVFKNQGFVSEEAINYFEIALDDNRKNPASRYYLSLAKSQRGNVEGAYKAWLELAKETPPDTPWYPLLQSQLEEAALKLGKDNTKIIGEKNTINTSGPTKEDIEAAAEMSSDDRKNMIEGMVENLAERMKKNPNDIKGWEMLARSYRVLGNIKKAEETEKIIEKLKISKN